MSGSAIRPAEVALRWSTAGCETADKTDCHINTVATAYHNHSQFIMIHTIHMQSLNDVTSTLIATVIVVSLRISRNLLTAMR